MFINNILIFLSIFIAFTSTTTGYFFNWGSSEQSNTPPPYYYQQRLVHPIYTLSGIADQQQASGGKSSGSVVNNYESQPVPVPAIPVQVPLQAQLSPMAYSNVRNVQLVPCLCPLSQDNDYERFDKNYPPESLYSNVQFQPQPSSQQQQQQQQQLPQEKKNLVFKK